MKNWIIFFSWICVAFIGQDLLAAGCETEVEIGSTSSLVKVPHVPLNEEIMPVLQVLGTEQSDAHGNKNVQSKGSLSGQIELRASGMLINVSGLKVTFELPGTSGRSLEVSGPGLVIEVSKSGVVIKQPNFDQ